MIFIFLIVLVIASINAEKDLILQLEDGFIEGFYKTSYNGRKFAAFEGIPFAGAPIGDYRFKDPLPVSKWNGTLIANKKYTCIQLMGDQKLGAEDCLYLNVYVPKIKINPNDNLDVIVLIHGGAFMMGTGSMFGGPEKIIDRDVIVINFNYRVGPFGFLANGDDVFQGNYGLKDQRQALRWVQANIKAFGGNKDSVTILGLSAGASSVHYHYFNLNSSEILFHKGWAQSGTSLDPWAFKITPSLGAKKLIADVGCSNNDNNVSFKCMQQKSALEITKSIKGLYKGNLLPLAPFAPTAESSINNLEPFLVTHPYAHLKNGHFLRRPLIISQTVDEGMLPSAMYYDKLEEVDKNWNKLAPYMLEFYHVPEENWTEISAKIKEFYFKGKNITKATYKTFLNICTQRLFHMGAELTAKMHAKADSDVFFMMSGYAGLGIPGVDLYSKEIEGVAHGADAKFIYESDTLQLGRLTPEEEKVKDVMLDFLVSFAKTGKPTSNGIDWNPVTKDGNLDYLLIQNPNDIKMKSTEHLGEFEFWKSLNIKGEKEIY